MVDLLGDQFSFNIVTSDRDRFDDSPYKGVVPDSWNKVGNAQVYYLSSHRTSLWAMARLLSRTPHDVLYLNSFFDPVFTQLPLWARRLGLLPRKPVVLAPRGEFAAASIANKRWKKVPYRWLVSITGLYHDLTWHAATSNEADDIRRGMGETAKRITIAGNMAVVSDEQFSPYDEIPRNAHRALRVVFLSRISSTKNLELALRSMARVQASVEFNIYGPIYDHRYWQKCQALMAELPPNVMARYCGPVAHSEVLPALRSHDLLFLPTRGESFGHVIFESLSVGTAVLIADTTPWRDLEQAGVGWDLPLDDEQSFADRIDRSAQMLTEGQLPTRKHVRDYVRAREAEAAVLASNRRLFLDALGTRSRDE